MDQVVVFRIRGSFGHFRKAYAVVSPVTYSFPPPTALCGLIGAVMGFDKHQYNDILNQGDFAFAVEVTRPVRKLRLTMNSSITKDNKYFRLHGQNPRTQIPYEFLKDPEYRISFWHSDTRLMAELADHLEQGTSVYTPCLGLAQCIAELHFEGVWSTRRMNDHESYDVHSIIPTDLLHEVHYETGKQYHRCRVPTRMNADREVTLFRELLVEENAQPLKVSAKGVFEVNGRHICFI